MPQEIIYYGAFVPLRLVAAYAIEVCRIIVEVIAAIDNCIGSARTGSLPSER
jgi:hypothetical protein